MAVCRLKKPYINCFRDALEGDPNGLCILHSRENNKDINSFNAAVKEKLAKEDYEFWEVFFPGPLNFFDGLKFDKPVIFGDAFFVKANFAGVEFNDVDFSGAFLVEADFRNTTFLGKADFRGAIFKREALFLGTTFQEVDFFDATFEEANFHGATLQEANFSNSAFEYAIFSFANITERVTFAGVRAGGPSNENHYWEGDLQFIQFGEKGVIRFVNLSLSQVEFSGTDLRRMEFDRVIWASWWGRAAVYDEVILHQQRWAHLAYVMKHGGLWGRTIPGEEGRLGKPSYAEFAPVERLYRQLKTNYEEERDFKRVGDFHYGEMEMHRRGSFWRQWMPSWYNFYRVLSGYGERPLRAFIWLLLLIPAWAGLVWWLGIDQTGAQTPDNYWKTLLFIFEKATLQRPPWADIQNINWLGKLLGSLSVLILPGQAALFILALRNRLGRRR